MHRNVIYKYDDISVIVTAQNVPLVPLMAFKSL